MSNLDKVLDKLEHVHQTGVNQWRAKCPAHDGRTNNSLAVSEGDSGRVLVHCFNGCGGADVMAAIGMTLADLYEDGPIRQLYRSLAAPTRKEEAEASYDSTVLALGKADRKAGRKQSAEDIRREREAFRRMKLRQRGECR